MPATISPYVVRAMGARAARRYFLTAERFGAAEALRIGFVHEVAAADIDARINELLGTRSTQPRVEAKRLVQDVASDRSMQRRGRYREGIADIRASDEGREGVQAFLEQAQAALARRHTWP